MQNFVQKGDVLEYTVPAGATVKSGDVVVVGALAGVAVKDGAEGETIALNLTGVFELPKVAGALAQGVVVYWNATNKQVTSTATDNTKLGNVFVAAVNGDAIVRVRLSN